MTMSMMMHILLVGVLFMPSSEVKWLQEGLLYCIFGSLRLGLNFFESTQETIFAPYRIG